MDNYRMGPVGDDNFISRRILSNILLLLVVVSFRFIHSLTRSDNKTTTKSYKNKKGLRCIHLSPCNVW